MAIDDLFQVRSEVWVQRGFVAQLFRMRFGQRDGFREQTARTRLRRPQYGHRPGVIFDDDFRACTNAGHQRGELARHFCFRDVDHILSHNLIIQRTSSLWTARSTCMSSWRVDREGGYERGPPL